MVEKTRVPIPTSPRRFVIPIGGKRSPWQKTKVKALKNTTISSNWNLTICKKLELTLFFANVHKHGFICLCKAINMSISLFVHQELDSNISSSSLHSLLVVIVAGCSWSYYFFLSIYLRIFWGCFLSCAKYFLLDVLEIFVPSSSHNLIMLFSTVYFPLLF